MTDRMEDYAETHPGGLQCLVENGGRDITDLFNKYHQTNRNRVLKGLQELYIGNLIEQRQEYADNDVQGLANDRPVLPHEIRFGREVYSVKALRDSEEHGKFPDLADALSPYLGLDATEALQVEEHENGPLMRFACLRGYIVATVEDIGYGLPEIQLDELRMFDGHTNEGYDIQYDAFVASDGFVYDLTSRYKMPIWANRPKKIPKLPAENEVAPHIDTIEKIKEVSKEGDFETKDVFEPTPTATFLQNTINQLVPVNQSSLAEGLEKQEHQTTGNSNTKGKEPESRTNSSKSRQLSRLEADLRRRKDEKVMREIARTWQEVIASDESTLPAAYPPKNNAKHTSDGVLQEKELEEGERSAQKDAVPPGMSRRALEVTKKRKPVFESDDGPPRKRR
ncbi:uncharacterized protein N0V96_003114 [Colletotrichum fioriniae]|uniref:uncharacterized protein n=1 Tax=Colletotrichum fioriniae TaxID=710243 RepID=UPI0032DBC963|nr:hypothetical protein N0V96_003114 [Colletotrichum fioriniae]